MTLVRRLRNMLQFRLEQFILRGALSRLMVIALALVLIAACAGLLVYGLAPPKTYGDPGTAVWWAFLRLTDSGYLGDDEGTLLRSVSTVLTVLGVVLFVGALIATMTQWLNNTIETLEGGYTPIAQNNHVLILGWGNRTARMVEQLVDSQGRVARFLSRHGGRRLRVVILAHRVSPALVQELKDRLGRRYNARRVLLRSGTPLRADHLRRVDFRHAAAVVLPAREFDTDAAAPDEATIKTLMSAAHVDGHDPADLPLMVAEIFDSDHIETARRAYPGPAEFIGTPLIISRLLAQNARHPGLSRVYGELLGGTGNQIFVRECDALAGERVVDIAACFSRAVLLGVARDGGLRPLHAHPEDRIDTGDRLAFVADRFEDCVADAPARAGPARRETAAADAAQRSRRVLVLGWNQKLVSLLAEFEAYRRESVAVDVFSMLSAEERETLLRRRGVIFEHAQVRQLQGDLSSPHEMATLGVHDYDTIIVVASDWLGSAEAADAHMLVGYLVLSQVLESAARRPNVILETMAADNAALFEAPGVERMISPDLQSSMLTQVALRRELHWVMEEVFGAGGAEIAFRSAKALGLDGAEHSFFDLQHRCAVEGEILLGWVAPHGNGAARLSLNPADKAGACRLSAHDELVVLSVA